jgi:hypothetical protein
MYSRMLMVTAINLRQIAHFFPDIQTESPVAGNASQKPHSGGGPRFGGNRRDWFPRLAGGILGYQRFRAKKSGNEY